MKTVALKDVTTNDMLEIVKYNKEHFGLEGLKICTIGGECYIEDPREDK